MALSTRALSRAAMIAALAISACSTDSNNTAAFAVTGSSPSEGQTIGANATVAISFNRAPKTASATFSPDVGAVNTAISGSAASFTPASGSFAAGTAYTVTVTATDAGNNGLAAPFVVHFNTAAPDTTPPAAVTDLAVVASSISDTGLTLTWTATGDDGTTGTATGYEVRYLAGAACPITIANFAAAGSTTGTGTPVPAGAPKAAGSTETLAVTGLTGSTSYCFALRVLDEVPNKSGLSNVANATTAAGPDTIFPAKPVLTAPPATIKATSIGLSWIAVGDDGTTGTVSDREIKFQSAGACSTFSAATFATTGTALSLGAPAPGGTQETATATGLTSKTTYCFIEKVADDAGNTTFSDVLTVTTLDGIAPAVPVLTATPGATNVFLHLIAVGDDGHVGQAAKYTLHFVGPLATCPATAADFVNPRVLVSPDNLPSPSPAGTQDTLPVLGLQQASQYCFALSVQDAAGNDSGFSAVLAATTGGTAQAAPSAITDLRATIDGDKLAGQTLNQTTTLSWTSPDTSDGEAPAHYSIRFATFAGKTCPLTAANVTSASEIANPLTPQSPGGEESFDVTVPIVDDAHGVCFAVLSQSLNSGLSAISDLAKPPLKISDLVDDAATGTDSSVNLTFTAPSFQTGTTAGEYTVAYLPQGNACPAFGSDIPGLDGAVVFDAGPATVNTIPVTGLNASTSYCFSIFVTDTDTDAAWSNVASITTKAAPVVTPPPPANLIFVSATTSTIDLQFDAAADNGANNSGVSFLYNVLFAAGADCSTFNAATATSVPLDETGLITAAGQHIATGISRLNAGTQYCVAVTATNAEGNTSALSNVLTASTQTAGGGGGAQPTAIVDLRATILGNNGSSNEDLTSVTTLSWSAPANAGGTAVSSYQILAGTNGSCPITADNLASQTVLADPPTPGAPGFKETYQAFAPITVDGDSVCFAVISKDGAGTASALSNVPLPPIGVTDLNQGDATNDTSADLGMSTPQFQTGTTAAPFQYALAPALEGGNCPQFGSDIAALPGGTLNPLPSGLENQHQLPISGLTPNSNYCVAVLSTDTDGDAAWSNVSPINTSDQSAPPSPPNLSVTGTTATTLSIQFDSVVDNDRAQTGVALKYNVVYEALADCSNIQSDNATTLVLDETGIVTAPGQHIAATITGLSPATQYCLFVQGINGGGQVGNGGEIVSGTTLGQGGGGGTTPPAAITDLTTRLQGDSLAPGSQGQNQQTAYLKWTAPGDANGQRVASYTIYTAADEGCPITGANLANAIKLPQTFPPAGPGGTEGVELQVTAVDTDDVCFVVTSTDTSGNTSGLSNGSLPPHISDDLSTTPGEPAESTENLGFSTFFQTGTTQKEAIAFAAVVSGGCPLNSSDFFNADTNLIVDATNGSALFTGLSSATDYCVGVRLTSNLNDISYSLATGFTTGTPPPPPDETPPGPVVIQAPQAGDATSSGTLLRWTAPADNGTDVSSGPVASYSVYYVTIAGPGSAADCAAIDPGTAGTQVAVQPSPAAAPGALETVTVKLAGSDKMPVCIAATATDAAGNTSVRQPFALITDTTAPAQVNPLIAQNASIGSIDLAFTDVGDDGTTGTAASFKLAFVKGACPGTFDFGSATLVTTQALPQVAGTAETLTVPGLDYSTTYCFGLAVLDAAGNASPTATAQGTTAAPDVAGDLTTLRADIAGGATTLNDTVHAALVTYVKSAVGAAALGTPDGAGLFIQPSDSPAVTVPTAVPAIFVGIDTSGLAVGDVIDLTATSAALLGCKTPPCTSANGLEVVTAASVAVRSHGHALPSVPDFSNLTTADYPAPITVANWPFESNLIDITGVITSPLAAGGFTSYFFNTAGVTAVRDSAFEFRIPTTLVTSLGLVTGQTIRVKNTPLFREEVTVSQANVEQVTPSAWVSADVIPGPTVSFNPASGTVTTTPAISVVYSLAMDPATVTGQAADGACTGSVQFSKDNFTTCLALTLTPSAGNTVFTLGLARLADGTSYQLKSTSAAQDATNHLGAVSASTSYSTPAAGGVCTSVSPIIISQVYGGGGGATSSVLRDFIELHNRSSADFTIPAGGWSVQYASATGATYAPTTIPAGSVIPAGGYFLINESTGTVGTSFTADVTNTTAMAAGAGRVILVNGTVAFNTATPTPALCATQGTSGTVTGGIVETVIDSVSYGSTTSCTTSAAAATGTQPSATASVARNLNGCTDTAKPSADFTIVSGAAIAPRSSAKLGTAAQFCSCDGTAGDGSVNGKGTAAGEIDLCNIQPPTSITPTHGAATPLAGRFTEATLPGGAVVKGQVGYGIASTDPLSQFVFTAGAANANCSGCGTNETEYTASLIAPAAGSYSWLWRFSLDNGSHWTYCDIKGAGATAANPFDATNLGSLVSQ